MEGTVIGCSGEDAPRVGGGHHLPSTSFVNIPHRKPSGRVCPQPKCHFVPDTLLFHRTVRTAEKGSRVSEVPWSSFIV